MTVTLESGLRLSCADRGDGPEPVVLLLPGPTDSWRSYGPVLDRLPPGLRAVAVSQRGHGDSDKPATGYRVEDLAGDVVPLLDRLSVGRAVLVGHSGSCLVARRVALDHPERVAGLVLEASPTTLRDEPGLHELVASIAALADPIDLDFARSFVVATSSDGLPPEVLDRFVEDVRTVPARVWQQLFSGLLQYDDTDELERLDVPTLLLWGDADPLIARDVQDELLRRLPLAELRVYPGVGHTPRWDDPARFSSDVAAFALARRARP